MEIVRYTPELKEEWNEFVKGSKNGTFLFNRAYMDYHSDRFRDFSLMFYRKDKLYCLLPANISGETVSSHGGLTYGGLVMGSECKAEGVLEVFDTLVSYLKDRGIKKLVYKPVPHIYHTLPAEEDLYALFRHDARLKVRNISSTLELQHLLRFNKDRREALRRAERNGVEVRLTDDYASFWKILEENLRATYGATPVHSVGEMQTLAGNFPENIKLWRAFVTGEMVGGVVTYVTSTVVHAQYISATPEGKRAGAVDLTVAIILEDAKSRLMPAGVRWFDLGTSNEDGGRQLNESLIYQKQGFGGRAVCYDTWELSL